MLDRIDLHVEVPLLEYKELNSGDGGEKSSVVRERVIEARDRQLHRFKKDVGVNCNATIPSRLMRGYCGLDSETSAYLEQVMGELNFSARAHDRILKVARTLADLEGVESIQMQHLLEAVQYRTLDRKLLM